MRLDLEVRVCISQGLMCGTWPITIGPAPRSMIVLISVRFSTLETMFSHALKSGTNAPLEAGFGGADTALTICKLVRLLFNVADPHCEIRPPAKALARLDTVGIEFRATWGGSVPAEWTCACIIADAISLDSFLRRVLQGYAALYSQRRV